MQMFLILVLCVFSVSAEAQGNNKGATPVEVENGPNNPIPVTIENSIPFDSLRSLRLQGSSATLGGIVAFRPLLPGLLHGLTLTVSTPSGTGQECRARAELSLFRSGVLTTKEIAIVEAINGNNSVSLDLLRPIELDFEEGVDVARLLLYVQSEITFDFCHATASGVYEVFQ